MFTKKFAVDALERMVRTLAQTGIALIGATSFDWFSADWQAIAGTSLTAAVLSLLTSIASTGIGDKGTPAIVPTGSVIPPGQ